MWDGGHEQAPSPVSHVSPPLPPHLCREDVSVYLQSPLTCSVTLSISFPIFPTKEVTGKRLSARGSPTELRPDPNSTWGVSAGCGHGAQPRCGPSGDRAVCRRVSKATAMPPEPVPFLPLSLSPSQAPKSSPFQGWAPLLCRLPQTLSPDLTSSQTPLFQVLRKKSSRN